MRMTSDEHGFEDRRRKRVAVILGQQTTQAREFAAPGGGERSAEKLNRACRRTAQSRQRVQQGRLAGAVTPQNGPALARRHDEIETAAHADSSDGYRKTAGGEQRRSHRCSRRSRL